MPPRRRAQATSAAKLPASRLPLGTHLPGAEPRPGSRNTDRSISQSSQCAVASEPDSTNESHGQSKSVTEPEAEKKSPIMPASDASNTSEDPTSRAEAKLRRQNERIQLAETALSAPPQHERSRERPQSRGKGKPTYNQMGITWDISQQPFGNEGGVPVSQTRVNTYAPASDSRETSLSRSVSSMSVATGAAGARDGRMDSLLDDAGFQTYLRGRRPKPTDGLSAYEVKPEAKQTTVEANFDQQEIRKVFAQQLPGLDFIQQQAGFRDHQLQFLQHPNGDVSAHMWNSAMFQWENIGNFSNIRKRVEGQLANDRLRGETGWQTLQKNTLAYFRAIAKQREQVKMGLPFGQDQIQALLPQLSDKKATSTSAASMATTQPTGGHVDTYDNTASPVGAAGRERTNSALDPTAGAYSHPTYQGARQSRLDQFQAQTEQKQRQRPEDPFTTNRPFQSAYYNAFAPPANAINKSTPSRIPTNSTAAGTSSTTPSFKLFTQEPQGSNTKASSFPTSDYPKLPAQKLEGAQSRTTFVECIDRRQSSFASNNSTATQSKPVTPLRTREAMRDHLLKLGETAKERSLSQTNIRTVMHDPYKKQSQGSDESFSQSAQRISPSLFRPGNKTDVQMPPRQRNQSTAIASGTPFAWQPGQQASKVTLQREVSLADSVPDTDYSYGTNHEPPTYTINTYHTDPLAAANAKKKSYEQELNDWWTSGNRFSRQEEFFQRIMAPHRKNSLTSSSVPDDPTTTSANPPRPIGAPAGSAAPQTPAARTQAQKIKAKEAAPINEDMTRILIPVYENLASYVEGPLDKRRDYWSNWSQPPEWCIDRSATGNNSFYDTNWVQPPARVGRDPRYRAVPGELQFGGLSPSYHSGGARMPNSGLSGGIPGMHGRYFGGGTPGRY